MLNVIPSNDATYFTVSHPELTNLATGIVLRMSLGCSSTLNSFSILPGAITSNSFTFTLNQAYPTNTPSKFADGIYYFEIAFDYNDEADVVNKDGSKCVFVDYDLKCTLDLSNQQKLDVYQALLYGNDCDACKCTKMCDMYNFLISTTTTSINDTTCGCD